MNYLLIEPAVKSIAYNIAMMKWARWCENKGHTYEYIRGCLEPTIIPDKILMACVFTFRSACYKKTIDFYHKRFPNAEFIVGGVAPSVIPKWFTDNFPFLKIHKGMCRKIEHLIPKYDVVVRDEDEFKVKKNDYHRRGKKIVLYASRGCVNKCGYCVVPKLEGKMKSYRTIKPILEQGLKEIPDAQSVVLYDNNFTEHRYLNHIVNELVEFGLPVDIHGLHVDSFDDRRAKILSRLTWASQSGTMPYIRFSFDKMKYRKHVHRALRLVDKYNYKVNFFAYALYNWLDSPDDLWNRMVYSQEMVDDVGRSMWLFCQRYEPLGALKKKQYVGKKWTKEQARGVDKVCTYFRGFLPITPSRNIFRWLGHDRETFKHNLYLMGSEKRHMLVKQPAGELIP